MAVVPGNEKSYLVLLQSYLFHLGQFLQHAGSTHS